MPGVLLGVQEIHTLLHMGLCRAYRVYGKFRFRVLM